MMFSSLFTAAMAFGTAIAAPTISTSTSTTVSTSALTAPTDAVSSQPDGCQTVHTQVDHLKVNIEEEMKFVTSIIKNQDAERAVPIVKESLESITKEIEGTVRNVGPLLLGITDTLSEADLEILLEIVEEVLEIVEDVKSEVTDIADKLGLDVVKQLETEIEKLLQILSPLVSPVLTLVYDVVGHTVEGDLVGLVEKIRTVAGELRSTLSIILAPVTGLLEGLLGGLIG